MNGMNTGVFIVNTSDKTLSALNYAYSLYEKYRTSTLNEQLAIVEALEKYNLSILLLDRTVFNATPLDRHNKTLVLHIMGKIKRYLDKSNWIELFCKN